MIGRLAGVNNSYSDFSSGYEYTDVAETQNRNVEPNYNLKNKDVNVLNHELFDI